MAGSSPHQQQQPPLLSACHRASHLPEGAPGSNINIQGGQGDQKDKPGGPGFIFEETLFLPDLLLIFIKCSGSANVPATIGATKTSN